MVLSPLQKIKSCFYPVKLRIGASEVNPLLELFYYQGQWQLATKDAIYSDGNRYRPMRLVFDKIETRLPQVKNVLVLGTGLGSAAVQLDNRGFHPFIDLVEIDPVILSWAKELLPERLQHSCHFICADAADYMQKNQKKYDLIVVDVFESRVVPAFIMETPFLSHCRNSLDDNGTVALNYIVGNKEEWNASQETFKMTFPDYAVYDLGLNRLIITK